MNTHFGRWRRAPHAEPEPPRTEDARAVPPKVQPEFRRIRISFDQRSVQATTIRILVIVSAWMVAAWVVGVARHFLFLILLAWLAAIASEPAIRWFLRRGLSRSPQFEQALPPEPCRRIGTIPPWSRPAHAALLRSARVLRGPKPREELAVGGESLLPLDPDARGGRGARSLGFARVELGIGRAGAGRPLVPVGGGGTGIGPGGRLARLV